MVTFLTIYFTIGFILAVLNFWVQLDIREAELIHYIGGFLALLFFWPVIWIYSLIRD